MCMLFVNLLSEKLVWTLFLPVLSISHPHHLCFAIYKHGNQLIGIFVL